MITLFIHCEMKKKIGFLCVRVGTIFSLFSAPNCIGTMM